MTPDRAARHRAVEKAVREQGWSAELGRDLAAEWSVSLQTIRRDWAIVQATLADDELGTREERRRKFLEELEEDLKNAREARFHPGIARYMSIRLQVEGLNVPPPEPEAETTDDEHGDKLLAELAEMQSMRREARSRGSMVAAVQLTKHISEHLATIEARDQARAELERQALDEEEVLGQLEGAAEQMPDVLVDRMIEILMRRRGIA